MIDMKFLVTLVTIVIMILSLNFVSFAVSEEAKQHYDTAKSLYVAGDTEGALAELEKALSIDPNYEQAKKLYEKLGGSKKKGTTEPTSNSQSQGSQLQVQPIQVSGSIMDRDTLKKNIAIVLSNSVGQIRGELFALVNDSVKESFDEMLRSGARNEVKAILKQAIFEIMKEILKEEINYSVGVIKEEVGSSPSPSAKIDFDIKTKEDMKSSTAPSSTSLSTISEENKSKARELYEKAIKLLDDENYSSAKEILIEANKLDPDNEDIKKALSRIPTK